MAGTAGLRSIASDFAALLVETDRSHEAWTVAERGRSRALLDLLAPREPSGWPVIVESAEYLVGEGVY